MKAFLSHSSFDREFVRFVVKELGRQYCLVDEQDFKTGDEFKEAIERGLDDSSVFVLFASYKALQSIWIKFEEEEAWFQRLRGSLSKSLVYIIDSSVKPENLPPWLQRTLIRHEISPKVIARDIRNHLDELLRDRQQLHFLGRDKDMKELTYYLVPIDGTPPPRAFFITGLPGIGRRTLVKQAATSILALSKHVEIRVGEGDSINDICRKVAEYVEPYSTNAGFERIAKQITSLSNQEATLRILENVRAMNNVSELPIFFDEGGLLDSEGYIREPVEIILRALMPVENAYIALISYQRPKDSFNLSIPVLHLKHLDQDDIKRLISMLANQLPKKPSHKEITQISEYVAGYPPAAYFAIKQVEYLGIDLILYDKSNLIEFRTSAFLRHLLKLKLDTNAQHLLRILTHYSPLPFSVLMEVLEGDPKTAQEVIIQLIDLALIILTKDGYYRIADPITSAAENIFGPLPENHLKSMVRALSTYLSSKQSRDLPRLELSSVLYRAALMAKDTTTANRVIHFANDLIRLTEKFYHTRNYEDAIEFGHKALRERPESVTARSYLIRALIKEEKWEEAEEQLDELQSYASLRDVYFLMGFLERNRGRILAAITAFLEALKLGRHDMPLSRELAHCYYLNGDLEEASKFIIEALERRNDNSYLIDMWAQIATAQGEETPARQALKRLELTGKPIYYHHRASRIAFLFGHKEEALEEAQMAFDIAMSENYVPFQVLAQLIYCEIDIGYLDDAEKHLVYLDQRFHIHRDIRLGLRCRLEIARGNYNAALRQSHRITNKKTSSYKYIKRDALAGELRESALSDSLRAAYEDELNRLEKELTGVKTIEIIPRELDDILS